MGPPRPKNPNRISIWAYEVSIACSQCSKPEPVVQPPKLWKKLFHREESSKSSKKSEKMKEKAALHGTVGTGDEMSRTAMYQPGIDGEATHGTQWGGDEFEGDNGESSLDMQSSESGVGWGARDRAQRLDRAERLLNTDAKKFKMAAVRQAAAVSS
jgi:hypothetical protein